MTMLNKSQNSVADVQRYLHDLYGRVNTNMTFDYMWGFASEKGGSLSRVTSRAFTHKIDANDTDAHFVSLFSWLAAIASSHGRDIERAFISKFPGICPYCLEAPCACLRTNRRPRNNWSIPEIKQELAERSRVYLGYDTRKPLTFELAVSIMDKVYPNNATDWLRSPEHHFAKIFEEFAELRIAVRHFKKGTEKPSAIDDELADIFAWSCSAWSLIHKNGDGLFNAFMEYYESGCPRCKTAPCKCEPDSDKLTSIFGSSDLVALLHALEPLKGIHNRELTETVAQIERSLRDALDEPMGFALKQALRETKEGVGKLSSGDLTAEQKISVSNVKEYLRKRAF